STTTANGVNGVATFNNLVLSRAGTYYFTVTAPNMAAVSSGTFNVTAALPTRLSFNPPPQAGTAGQVLPPFAVQLLDQFGNPTSSSSTVSITLAGPGGLTAGTTSVAAVNGVATFNGLVVQA